MIYCKATKIIISADYHGTIVIASEIQCKLKEVGPQEPVILLLGVPYGTGIWSRE